MLSHKDLVQERDKIQSLAATHLASAEKAVEIIAELFKIPLENVKHSSPLYQTCQKLY